jgi:DNA-binding CsgD family transcriptional regulator
MPIANALDAITPRMAAMLGMLLDQQHRPAVARAFDLSLSAVRDELHKAMAITQTDNQDELVRWWRRHRVAWALRVLERADIEVEELVRISGLGAGR